MGTTIPWRMTRRNTRYFSVSEEECLVMLDVFIYFLYIFWLPFWCLFLYMHAHRHGLQNGEMANCEAWPDGDFAICGQKSSTTAHDLLCW